MDLIRDIVRDFVNRSREELGLLDRGLAEWRAVPDEPNKLTFLAEILHSLQEMSGLLAFPELESLFLDGHSLLLAVRQRWPHPCLEVIAELEELIKNGRRLLSEIESPQNDDSSVTPSGEVLATSQAHPALPGGPPLPFRPRESLRAPAISLTDFIVENLADAEENAEHDSTHMGARLVRLIDEVMTARHQIRQLFAHAVSLSSQRERSAFLDQACAERPELRMSLERLLMSESLSQRLLKSATSELIRALLESLRSEVTPPVSQGPPLTLTLTVPDDELLDRDLESTVNVRPSGAFVGPAAETPNVDPSILPRPFGRYTLERELGKGAMGTVFLASDRLLNRQVALKLLRVKPEDGQETVERFYREARSMASLQHANLCPIYDFGEVDWQPYLTMAFIQGRPLSEYLVDHRPLVTRYAVNLARTLASALHQAHQVGIVHRDLKPANIMINKDGEPVLMDFGLARRTQPGELAITQQGMILGSPAYMAPEQVEGDIDQFGPATDVHALGVILYEMLSGRKPFDGTVASVLAQIHSKEAEPLVIPEDTEGRLDQICRQAMAKAVSERYASALGFANALTEYLEGANRVRARSEVDVTPQAETAEQDSAAVSPNRTSQVEVFPIPGRRRWRWAVAAAALIGITFVTIKLSSRNPSRSIPLKVGSADSLREDR